MSGAAGILAGLRVIEGSAFVAAPLGGMTLAQLGAGTSPRRSLALAERGDAQARSRMRRARRTTGRSIISPSIITTPESPASS
jgi:hypothetical protein